jgi:hypothetical protein
LPDTIETTALTVRKAELVAGEMVAPIIPRTIEEVARIARAILAGGLKPASYEGNTPEETISKVMIGIMKAAEVGLPPITGLSTICIVNGRPSVYGDGAIALCQSRGVIEWIKQSFSGEREKDDWTATFTIKRRHQSEPYVGTFSVAQAKRAGLWNNPKRQPWMLYPERMLLARARAYALREGFADCLSGLSIAEEVQDIPEGPKEVVSTAFLDDAPVIENQPAVATPEPGEDRIAKAIEAGELDEHKFGPGW